MGTQKYMMAFFDSVDVDKNGRITLDEFCAVSEDPVMRAWMSAMEIDVATDTELVFSLVDVDGTGSITLDEMMFGFSRLKGAAKSTDVRQLMTMIGHLEERVGFI